MIARSNVPIWIQSLKAACFLNIYMEVEETSVVKAVSKTPELDADLPAKGTPRLVIEKLVLENFKSYAGVKVCVWMVA